MKSLLILPVLLSVGCNTRLETYQENIHRQEVDRVIVETINERNFRMWQANQTRFVGMKPFKSVTPCPAMNGHMVYTESEWEPVRISKSYEIHHH